MDNDNNPPVAVAPSRVLTPIPGQTEVRYEDIALSGAQSFDPDNIAVLRYQWTLLSRPAVAPDFGLQGRTSSELQLSGLVPGIFTFSLNVMDELGLQSSATARVYAISISDISPTEQCFAGFDCYFTWTTKGVPANSEMALTIDLQYPLGVGGGRSPRQETRVPLSSDFILRGSSLVAGDGFSLALTLEGTYPQFGYHTATFTGPRFNVVDRYYFETSSFR